MDDVARLLPGDPAPELRLSRWFVEGETGGDRDDGGDRAGAAGNAAPVIEPIHLDRPSLVVLWNGACSVCLPAIRELAEVGANYDVPCYGVAVMVHDVEKTERIAFGSPSKARLALGERPPKPFAFSRGPMTRRWLEPSGVGGVPVAFAIDKNGTIARIGQPDEIGAILPTSLNGQWDVGAERRRWASAVSHDTVRALRTRMDATDLRFAGKPDEALATIGEAERRWPGVSTDKQLNVTKLHILMEAPDRRDEAIAHYAACSAAAADDRQVQLSLAGWVLALMPTQGALEIAVDRLGALEDQIEQQVAQRDGADPTDGAGPPDDDAQIDLLTRIALFVTLADVLVRLDRASEAASRIERAEALLAIGGLADRHRASFAPEIDKVRQAIGAAH